MIEEYVVQSLGSETGHVVAHRWRRGMVPCQLVSRPRKRHLSTWTVNMTTVVVVTVI